MSENEITRWEKTRAKGKWRFIAIRAGAFALMLFLIKISMDLLWGDPIGVRPYFFWLYPILGLIGSATLWWITDARYQDYILDRKIHDRLKL